MRNVENIFLGVLRRVNLCIGILGIFFDTKTDFILRMLGFKDWF